MPAGGVTAMSGAHWHANARTGFTFLIPGGRGSLSGNGGGSLVGAVARSGGDGGGRATAPEARGGETGPPAGGRGGEAPSGPLGGGVPPAPPQAADAACGRHSGDDSRRES